LLETMLQNLLAQSSNWVNDIFSFSLLRQIIVFGGVLLVAWVLRFLLWRLVSILETRFAQTGWLAKVFTIIGQALFPLTTLALSWPVINIFQASGWEQTFLLTWMIPFVGLWLLYRLLSGVLRLNLPAIQAHLWSRKVLLPLLILMGILNGLGFLDDILQTGLTSDGAQPITVRSIITGLITIAIFFILARGLGRFLGQVFLPQAGAEPALAHALASLVTYSTVIIGAIIALSTTGLNLTTLTVILGGLSVGLGFGLQAIVNNFISGFILTFEGSIGPGNIIQVGDIQGTVQSIGIRSMVIKTGDNVELIIPNSHFLSETMINLTLSDPILRVRITVGVNYEANPREVEQALLEAAQHPYVLAEPAPSVQFRDFGSSSLNFDLLVWTAEPTRIATLTSDLRYSIWDTLAARNIRIPSPQQSVDVRLSMPPANQPASAD